MQVATPANQNSCCVVDVAVRYGVCFLDCEFVVLLLLLMVLVFLLSLGFSLVSAMGGLFGRSGIR